MKITWKKALPLVALCLISSETFAHALGLELEPYAGYGTSGKLTDGDATTKYSMLGLGARLNIKLTKFLYIGPDFSYQLGLNGTASASDATLGDVSGNLTKGNLMTVGAVAGLQLPAGIRVWFGYNFLDQNTGTASLGNDALTASGGTFAATNKYTGTSMKVGAGFKLFSAVRLNAEYYLQNYTKSDRTTTYNGTDTTTSNTYSGTLPSAQMILVTLSAALGKN